MAHISQHSAAILKQLRDATSQVGGWERAISDAKKRRKGFVREADSDRSSTETSSWSSGTLKLPEGVTASYEEVPSATPLRRCFAKITGPTTVPDDEQPKDVASPSHSLVDYPNSQSSALAAEYSELESESVSSGPQCVQRIPRPKTLQCINLSHRSYMSSSFPGHRSSYWSLHWIFTIDFVAPIIRPVYMFEKTVATSGTFVLFIPSLRRSSYLTPIQARSSPSRGCCWTCRYHSC
jgi:sterol O-acyltransferase